MDPEAAKFRMFFGMRGGRLQITITSLFLNYYLRSMRTLLMGLFILTLGVFMSCGYSSTAPSDKSSDLVYELADITVGEQVFADEMRVDVQKAEITGLFSETAIALAVDIPASERSTEFQGNVNPDVDIGKAQRNNITHYDPNCPIRYCWQSTFS